MKRRGWAIAAIVAAMAFFVGWPVTATLARGQVVVYTDAEPLVCLDRPTTIIGMDETDETAPHVVAAEVTKDLRCEQRIFVRNDSAFAAEITEVWLPYMGEDTGVPVRVLTIDGEEPSEVDPLSMNPRESSIDARVRFASPVILQPGEIHLIVAALGFNSNGCIAQGGSTTIRPEHPVTISLLGFSGEPVYTGAAYGFAAASGDASSCDS